MSRVRTRGKDLSPVFAALGSATRLELLSRLSDGQQHSISELTDGLGLSLALAGALFAATSIRRPVETAAE